MSSTHFYQSTDLINSPYSSPSNTESCSRNLCNCGFGHSIYPRQLAMTGIRRCFFFQLRQFFSTRVISLLGISVLPSFVYSFIHNQLLYTPLLHLGLLFIFVIFFTKTVGLLGRGINPSQGRCLHTEQHKHRLNAHTHKFVDWDSNSRSQCLSERKQFMS
jgi:hypothetical protein